MGTPLVFHPYHDLRGRPNVIVDGSATAGTVLCLSHWPHTPCPAGCEADLSAEMAFRYLGCSHLHGDAGLVSNNHFDQDGLVSMFTLVDPEAALAHRELLMDLASAGDFGTYRSRDAARASMAIAAFADPGTVAPAGTPLRLPGGDGRALRGPARARRRAGHPYGPLFGPVAGRGRVPHGK